MTAIFLIASVVGTGDRGAYERMLLYSAYIAEEFDKPATFTILPGCAGSRIVETIAVPRCTFYEMCRHIWHESKHQPVMPAAGEPPTDPAKRKQWYIQTLGDHFVNKKTNEEVFRIGLRPEQDGQRFATSWVGNQPGLEGKMVREKWDQWMNTGKMASGATSLPEVFEKIGKVVSTARLNLFNQNRELAAPQTALFAFAEEVGTIVENLRVEDNEKWRTGAVIGPDSGRGAIADRLKATPEFIAGLTADELKNFAVEVKLSPVASKRGTKPWPIFDPVATKAKWGEKVKDIEAVMTRVSDTYMREPAPSEHNLQIDAIRKTNRQIKNWDSEIKGLCTL
ncbi:hypothetical protein GLAREA_04108 [Glarea lozoyensis ATCC 20868]|uniref:Uncharacterized protein n=1 Tax=Glarea lozoyensis (strain ATCC 20868 / MF5171) TaxID=1116229 RepID=S3DGI1_GLAL2|nr:uncharacterized protein GLAREA_04108 [Glarea lozoyensis ATCC 20868]EPE31141.1 hypothetical protein GLAREA_04108 [Glarea lozoyensis ATCC 20868]